MNAALEPMTDEPMALTVHTAPSAPPSLFGTTDPVTVIEKAGTVANALKEVIRKQKLISNIGGKEYPRCEAWTLLGTMLGVFPVLIWTRKLETGWEARVEARTRDGAVVGCAEAQCLNTERNWNNRDDFALRSMAQTRATAKCLRMPLGFVMTLSGFEPTPAEEMTFEPPVKREPPPPPKPKVRADATPEQKAKMVKLFESEGSDAVQAALGYFIDVGAILPTETLESVPLRFVPATMGEMKELAGLIAVCNMEGKSTRPSWAADPGRVNVVNPRPVEVPRESPTPEGDWHSFPMPWGKQAGTPLGELEKNYLFGLWANYKVETEYKGKPKKPETIAKDEEFRAMLDLAGEHYQFKDNG